jgi:thiol-disulfide isomerase/thioredoxin
MFFGHPVTELSLENKADLSSHPVFSRKREVVVVAIYSPTCPYCINMKYAFVQAALRVSPLVSFFAVNGKARENNNFVKKYGIASFPTILAFDMSQSVPQVYTFGNARTTDAFAAFAKGMRGHALRKKHKKTY